MMSDVKFAYELSKRLHFGQKYGGKDYFHHHILGVLGVLQHELGVQDEGFHIVAMLHDVLEDTTLEYKALCSLFSLDIPEDVLHLTKFSDTSYEDYIQDILDSGSMRARTVKIADTTFNYRESVRGGWEMAGKCGAIQEGDYAACDRRAVV